MRQKTIKRAISCSGIGLHSGKKVTLTLRPAPEDCGIIFHHKGAQGKTVLTLSPGKVVSTGLATTIGQGTVSIATVEHLLGAVYGLGVDNLYVEVSGEELPIMDGSAASFVFLLRSAGLRNQSKPKNTEANDNPDIICLNTDRQQSSKTNLCILCSPWLKTLMPQALR
jgi:UDP-3-O-[3-hydroxymyristoyl] N-acetylglucosamine deacetylase